MKFILVDLLGLLKWRIQKEKLMTILPALMKVSGQEIVKVKFAFTVYTRVNYEIIHPQLRIFVCFAMSGHQGLSQCISIIF